MEALLAAEKKEAAWRRRIMEDLTRNLYRGLPGEKTTPPRSPQKAGEEGGRTADEIKSDVLAMLAGRKETR